MRRRESYPDQLARLYPELFKNENDEVTFNEGKHCRTLTFQVTDACNLSCTYCYQCNKGTRQMKFEYAKKMIDYILHNDEKISDYFGIEKTPGIVIEFIGGEPFLNIDLIEQICDYFMDQAIQLHHPYAILSCFSICSNGVLYFDEKVQKFLNKYANKLSLSITIDGNKELHDACRIFPDGSPSYDIAVAAAKDWISRGKYMGSKITIAPGNLDYLYDAIIHMVSLGYDEINANTVFEKGWTIEHAKKFYYMLKRVADYWVDNNIVETHYLSLFEEDFFCPKDEDDDNNWCGGTGSMLSMDPDGYLYPCIRYMESSLGSTREPLCIGHIDTGIGKTECHKNCIDCLNNITRRSQSTDECFYCPIASGCAWCSAYNYQETGTPNKRVTYICDMHKARSLANVYFWNKYYKKSNTDKVFKMYCPKEWALEIIGIEEYNMLLSLSEEK